MILDDWKWLKNHETIMINDFNRVTSCKIHELTEMSSGGDDGDESDKNIQARDRRYSCLKFNKK